DQNQTVVEYNPSLAAHRPNHACEKQNGGERQQRRKPVQFMRLAAGFAFFFCDGEILIPQKIAGKPSTSVMLVTLLTSELTITSAPEPPLRPRMKAKMRLPMPVQYGITSVPSTVPSKPWALNTSSRQSIRNDAARNTAR